MAAPTHHEISAKTSSSTYSGDGQAQYPATVAAICAAALLSPDSQHDPSAISRSADESIAAAAAAVHSFTRATKVPVAPTGTVAKLLSMPMQYLTPTYDHARVAAAAAASGRPGVTAYVKTLDEDDLHLLPGGASLKQLLLLYR
jgi:hypothetical protein